MKARIPKSFLNLPKKEKDIINQVLTDELYKRVVAEEVLLQKLWLKMASIVLHSSFGFGRKRLMIFLGNWKRLYKKNAAFINSKEQEQFFAEEMEKIFRKEGYPEDFVNSLADDL